MTIGAKQRFACQFARAISGYRQTRSIIFFELVKFAPVYKSCNEIVSVKILSEVRRHQTVEFLDIMQRSRSI